jgi:hypothetical protein
MKGRTDLEEYYKAVEEMTNFLPIKQGGATFRPGTVYANIAGTLSNNYVIFPFSPEDGRNYMVMISPGYDLKITDLANGVSTINKPTYIFNKHIDFSDSTGVFDPAADGGLTTRIFQNLQFTSNGDVFVIIDGTGTLAPIIGKRTATNTFLIDSILYPTVVNPSTNVLWLDTSAKYPIRVPYKDTNIDPEITLTPSGLTGSITITSKNAAGTPISFFTGNPVGMYIKITQGTSTGVAIVRSKVSDSVVNAQIWNISFTATTASNNWEVSAWNAKDGYPKSATFYEGRLYFGGNNTFPDTIWSSLVGNIYHFMQRRLIQDATANTSLLNYYGTVKETDPFNFTIASASANAIQWMYPSDTLIIGTTGTEYSISGGTDSILSIQSINVRAISSHGSAKVQPVKVGSSILFVSYDGKRLLEIPKRLQEYVSATDLSSIAEGIIDKAVDLTGDTTTNFYNNMKMAQLAYQENEGIVWILLRDVVYQKTCMLSLSVDRTSKTLGWAKHTFPTTSTENATIYGIAVSPDPNRGNYSFLYLSTYRSSFSAQYLIEKLWFRTRYSRMDQNTSFSTVVADKSVNYMDLASFVAAPPSGTTVAIPTIFRGSATVAVMTTSGEYLGTFTAVGSNLTIPNASTYPGFIVGYRYTGEIKTLPLEAGAQFGVAQGTSRRTHEISVAVDRSRGGKYKASRAIDEFDLIKSTDATAAALYSGEKKLSLNASPDDNQLYIKQDQPYPLTILWILRKGFTNDA